MPWFDSAIYVLVTPVLWWMFLNGWDELFLDVSFLCLKLRGIGGPTWPDGPPEAEKRVAIFVPLWREDGVIEEMVRHNIAVLEYANYDFFLGVYRNDPATMEKVRALEERYPNVHRALCPHDGPTNKADCLNWIYLRMAAEEQKRGARYDIVVQHDAEDIIHPKALRLINALAAGFDMVQVPVFPLATGFGEFTHGTYCDEFAEWQVKDIYTRQRLGGFVPSAGVGTAYRREVLEEIARGSEHRTIFQVNTHTEDYEVGLRLKLMDKTQALVLHEVARARNGNGNRGNGRARNGNGNGKRPNGRRGNGKAANGVRNGNGRLGNGGREFVATREYFPRSFRGAVRQKTRWVMGVSLQTWQHRGWPGGPRQLYWLWRDRKGLIGNPATLLCNAIFAYCLLMLLAARALGTGWTLPRVIPTQGAAWYLLAMNTFFLLERVSFRVYAVRKIYGLRQACWSVLRIPWANTINFCATVSALATWTAALFARRSVEWSKTEHAFPDRAQQMELRQPLGELLIEQGLITADDLEAALEAQEQEADPRRVGELLVARGVLSAQQLVAVLARQQGLETWNEDTSAIPAGIGQILSRDLCRRLRVIPVAFRNGRTLIVAAPDVLEEEALAALRAESGLDVQQVLATPAAWRAGFAHVYGPSLGDTLVVLGYLSEQQLADAEALAQQAHYPLAQVLFDRGWAGQEALEAAYRALGVEFRRLAPSDVAPDVAAAVPAALQHELWAVPLERRRDAIVVAIAEALVESDHRRLESAARSRVHFIYTLLSDLKALLPKSDAADGP